MRALEEMTDSPRPTPGLRKTIDTILRVMRQSPDSDGAPPATTADAAELMRMFRDDLQAGREDAEPAGRQERMSPEQEEAADLLRIRRALYEA
ncbi:hypothetical protein [Histidinibacterium lentulum]|nr:hypothetical protein [Histidinibacterium lentulum]